MCSVDVTGTDTADSVVQSGETETAVAEYNSGSRGKVSSPEVDVGCESGGEFDK